MKATKKNIKAAAINYVKTKNLTELCKSMKSMGIINQYDIYRAIQGVISKRMFDKANFFAVLTSVPYNRQYDGGTHLHRSLDDKKSKTQILIDSLEVRYNFVQEMKANKASGNYMKVLVVGGKHIWWAHPYYGLNDYNKGIWRENTPENRAKAEKINAYLMK